MNLLITNKRKEYEEVEGTKEHSKVPIHLF